MKKSLALLLLSGCSLADPYVGYQRCGCGVDNTGREVFACLYDDGSGVAEIVIAGFCADGSTCSVDSIVSNDGDDVLCLPTGGN